MKVGKRIAAVFLAVAMSFALAMPVAAVYPVDSRKISSVDDLLIGTDVKGVVSSAIAIDANTGILLEKQEDGSFYGTVEIPDTSATAVPIIRTNFYLSLHSGVAGVANKYTLVISWDGNGQIGNMRANEISVNNGSVLRPQEYYWKEDYYVTCGGATSGSRSAGIFNIPEDVTAVFVETKGFRAYVLNSSMWYESELAGIFDL